MTCRIQPVIGEENIVTILQENQAMIPCYWHQRHIFCTYYMLQLLRRGLKVGFLVSPSVDGEVPAQIMRDWGAHVTRGSHTRTGAQALRDLYQLIKKDGVSPVNTPDGPSGPVRLFKPGTIMLAQLSQTPIVPISYAANRVWQLKTWDEFIIPKPFSRIQIVVGKPQYIPKTLSEQERESARKLTEDALLNADALAEQQFDNKN